MIEAIQRAYYLEARNPSDRSTLLDLADNLGLDPDRTLLTDPSGRPQHLTMDGRALAELA